MTYRLEIAETAHADIRQTTRWLRDQASQRVADRWLTGLHKAIKTLATRPLRCPLAAENDLFPEEIRELLYGKGRNRYRIIFAIRGDTVVVLYVHHAARDQLRP